MHRRANVGVAVSVGLLFLIVTGLTWSWVAGTGIVKLRETMDWYTPKPAIIATAPANYDQSEVSSAINFARAEGPSGKIELTPSEASTVWMAKEAREERRMGIETVAVDGSTGVMVDRTHFANWSLPAKLTRWLISAYVGILSGWVNQLVLALIGVALLAMIVCGHVMWFGRGRGGRPGRFPAPTRWRDTRPGIAAAAVAPLIAYSAAVPLFGMMLVGSVIIDWAWRKLRRGQCRLCRSRVPCVSGDTPGAGKRRVRLTRFSNFEENIDVRKPNSTILVGFPRGQERFLKPRRTA